MFVKFEGVYNKGFLPPQKTQIKLCLKINQKKTQDEIETIVK